MNFRYALVWHWSKNRDDDVHIEGIFDTKTDAQLYLNNIRNKFSKNTVFSILSIPINQMIGA